MIDRGANVNIQNEKNGKTALHFACEKKKRNDNWYIVRKWCRYINKGQLRKNSSKLCWRRNRNFIKNKSNFRLGRNRKRY